MGRGGSLRLPLFALLGFDQDILVVIILDVSEGFKHCSGDRRTGIPLYDIHNSSFARMSRRAKITILIISPSKETPT
jgi:hypothetical protein